MKKLFVAATVILLTFAITAPVQGQSLKIGVGGGLTMVMGPDIFTNNIGEGGAGFGSEYHFGAKAKVGLPLLPITITGHFMYNKFGSSKTINNAEVEYATNFTTLGVGGELSFVPGPISPYGALDLFYTGLGEFTEKVDGNETYKSDSDSRFGIGFGVGADITLIPKINIDVMIKYQMNNLFGKEDNEDPFNTISLSTLIMFGLL